MAITCKKRQRESRPARLDLRGGPCTSETGVGRDITLQQSCHSCVGFPVLQQLPFRALPLSSSPTHHLMLLLLLLLISLSRPF